MYHDIKHKSLSNMHTYRLYIILAVCSVEHVNCYVIYNIPFILASLFFIQTFSINLQCFTKNVSLFSLTIYWIYNLTIDVLQFVPHDNGCIHFGHVINKSKVIIIKINHVLMMYMARGVYNVI